MPQLIFFSELNIDTTTNHLALMLYFANPSFKKYIIDNITNTDSRAIVATNKGDMSI